MSQQLIQYSLCGLLGVGFFLICAFLGQLIRGVLRVLVKWVGDEPLLVLMPLSSVPVFLRLDVYN